MSSDFHMDMVTGTDTLSLNKNIIKNLNTFLADK